MKGGRLRRARWQPESISGRCSSFAAGPCRPSSPARAALGPRTVIWSATSFRVGVRRAPALPTVQPGGDRAGVVERKRESGPRDEGLGEGARIGRRAAHASTHAGTGREEAARATKARPRRRRRRRARAEPSSRPTGVSVLPSLQCCPKGLETRGRIRARVSCVPSSLRSPSRSSASRSSLPFSPRRRRRGSSGSGARSAVTRPTAPRTWASGSTTRTSRFSTRWSGGCRSRRG